MQNFLNSPPGTTQKNKKIANHLILVISDFIIHLYSWSHLGLNQGLPDYESGALTNWAMGPLMTRASQKATAKLNLFF